MSESSCYKGEVLTGRLSSGTISLHSVGSSAAASLQTGKRAATAKHLAQCVHTAAAVLPAALPPRTDTQRERASSSTWR